MEMSQPVPEILQLIETNTPDELKAIPNWLVWRYVTSPKGKVSKPSFDAKTGRIGSPTNRATWTSYEEAILFYLSHSQEYNGLTFALTQEVGIIVIDLDHCIVPVANSFRRELTPTAKKIGSLAKSYTEISPSQNGLHIFLKGKISGTSRVGKEAEVYGDRRLITITGKKISQATEIQENQKALDEICALIFPTTDAPEQPRQIYGPVMSQTDNRVLEKALNARNGDKFRRLFYGGDTSGYKSHSEAHIALISMLAYWTNSDDKQIEDIFKGSAFFDEETAEKWDKRHNSNGETYGQMTIRKAIRGKQTY